MAATGNIRAVKILTRVKMKVVDEGVEKERVVQDHVHVLAQKKGRVEKDQRVEKRVMIEKMASWKATLIAMAIEIGTIIREKGKRKKREQSLKVVFNDDDE
jgi:hypothetical protein